MNEVRDALASLEKRFRTFSQQQFIFVTALERCSNTAFEQTRKVTTISQVYNYAEHIANNATDKRICNIFLSLVRDLGEFRRMLTKLVRNCPDTQLSTYFSTWKRILEGRQNISNLRATYPFSHVNHLSCDEARNHYGGVVSLIPCAMECARNAVERIEVIRAYRNIVNNTPAVTPQKREKIGRFQRRGIPAETPELPSPAMSSPVSNVSRCSIHSQRSNRSSVAQISRPHSAMPDMQNERPKNKPILKYRCSAATQTSNCLEPQVDWARRTVSQCEMRKLLKQRKTLLARPEWKP